MKLYIAEKPSLGRAIASAIASTLGKGNKNQQGYIECANGDLVTWCIGHILEQAEPEAYNAVYKKWQFEQLPIIPTTWQLIPKTNTKKQLTVIKKLVKQADQLIHAGDPDREGQLLVDEVIDYLNTPKTKRENTKRLLISDLNLPAVKRALTNLKSNQTFMPLSISALARARADWLYGINLTRAYTIQGQKTGFNSVLSVGRVQTPVLGLVVERDQQIANFQAKPFYEVLAHLRKKDTPEQNSFTAKWQPSEACQPYMDEENRVLVKGLAENVVTRIHNKPATVTKINNQQKKQAPPLPYNLSSLQIDAAKRFSMNAKLVLDVCQSLYEKHKLITYPRSDCRYLPNEHHQQAKQIINTLANANTKADAQTNTQKNANVQINHFANKADPTIKSKAWNNSKVGAHHAIIPTEKSFNTCQLNTFEQNIYHLIVLQYLAQFYPHYIYDETQLEITIAGGLFTTTSKFEKQQGWKLVLERKKSRNNKEGNKSTTITEPPPQVLPPLKQGDILHCQQGELLSKQTQAPKAYTDATLLAAMTNIARYVHDKNIKKILKETDGLGTEATRAGIIELLFKRQYLTRVGKTIQATDIGKALISALPKSATTPDMTAQWEAQLNAISEKQTSYQHFMQPLQQQLTIMIQQASQQQLIGLPKVAFKAKRKTRKFTRKKKVA